MPTEIRRPSAAIIEVARTADARLLGIAPLGVIAFLAFVLHLAAGAVLDRSHASQLAPAAVGVADDEAICAAEAKPPEPALPYD
jgi:hypothetical protein